MSTGKTKKTGPRETKPTPEVKQTTRRATAARPVAVRKVVAPKAVIPRRAKKAPASALPAEENLGSLPAHYGTNSLFLIARDPEWFFSYWDVRWSDYPAKSMLGGAFKIYLRLFCREGELSTNEVFHDAPNWYLRVPWPGGIFRAELGFFSAQGQWTIIATSNDAVAPSDSVSQENKALFATVPAHITFQRVLDMVKEARSGEEPPVETLARLQDEGRKLALAFGKITDWSESERSTLAAMFADQLSSESLSSEAFSSQLQTLLKEKLSSGGASDLLAAVSREHLSSGAGSATLAGLREKLSSELSSSIVAQLSQGLSSQTTSGLMALIKSTLSSTLSSELLGGIRESLSSQSTSAFGVRLRESLSSETSSAFGSILRETLASEFSSALLGRLRESLSSVTTSAFGVSLRASLSSETSSALSLFLRETLSSELSSALFSRLRETLSSQSSSGFAETLTSAGFLSSWMNEQLSSELSSRFLALWLTETMASWTSSELMSRGVLWKPEMSSLFSGFGAFSSFSSWGAYGSETLALFSATGPFGSSSGSSFGSSFGSDLSSWSSSPGGASSWGAGSAQSLTLDLSAEVTLHGVATPHTTLYIAGLPVTTDGAGRFSATFHAKPGGEPVDIVASVPGGTAARTAVRLVRE